MKTIFVILFLLCFFIVSIPLYLILWVIGKISPHKKVQYSQAIVVAVFNIILFFCGVKKTVIGRENIPKGQPVLYVSNHRSFFDILVGYTSVTTLTGFVAKKEMEKVPFINVWMRNLKCLFIDRENVKEGLKTILKGVEQVKQGYSVFISPEGTRNHGKEMLPFKEGSLKIAEKAKCPIIPVSMSNTDDVLENHFPWIRKTHVIIEFGQPVYLNELEKEQQKFPGAYVQDIIRKTLEKNAEILF